MTKELEVDEQQEKEFEEEEKNQMANQEEPPATQPIREKFFPDHYFIITDGADFHPLGQKTLQFVREKQFPYFMKLGLKLGATAPHSHGQQFEDLMQNLLVLVRIHIERVL